MDVRNSMSNTMVNLGVIVVSVVLSAIFSSFVGDFYNNLTQSGLGGGLYGDESFWELVLGFPLALIFFFAVLFSAIGKDKWKKWLYWSLVLPFLFELIFDLSHIYIPITLALIGYGIGLGVRKLLRR